MVRKLTLIVCVGAIFSAAAWATAARADEAALTDMFGSGVHAFNSRNYRQAYSDFAAAIEAGSRDPRVYYFRGLCNLNFGRAKDAQKDFGVGSQMEATDLDHFYDVSKSLERVQGRARVTVEQYRSQARVAAVREREKMRMERYNVLRPGEGGASEGVSTPAASAQPSAPTATPMPPADPFAASAPAATPAAPAKADDPFGNAAPAAAPAAAAPAAPAPAVPAPAAPGGAAPPAPEPAAPAPAVPAPAPAAPAPAAPGAEAPAPAAPGGAAPAAPAPAAPGAEAPAPAAPAAPAVPEKSPF